MQAKVVDMNVRLSISAPDDATWAANAQKLIFYAEEADVRLDMVTAHALTLNNDRARCSFGITITTTSNQAARLEEILCKAGLSPPFMLEATPILPQDDPDEKKILEKLYTGGDTSKRAPKPTDRELPSSSTKYEMTATQYSEYMHGAGMRVK